jgi:hypothetical protein
MYFPSSMKTIDMSDPFVPKDLIGKCDNFTFSINFSSFPV